jgi:hypothetical protein
MIACRPVTDDFQIKVDRDWKSGPVFSLFAVCVTGPLSTTISVWTPVHVRKVSLKDINCGLVCMMWVLQHQENMKKT